MAFRVRAEQPTLLRSALTSCTTRATTPDAVAVAFGVLDGLGAVEALVVVFRVLGDAVVLGLGTVVRAVCRGGVAFGLGAVVFPALVAGA
ncbi:hypothetical protein [Streptomyces sp. NPDC001076]